MLEKNTTLDPQCWDVHGSPIPALLASSLPAAKLLGLSETRGLSVEHSDIVYSAVKADTHEGQ